MAAGKMLNVEKLAQLQYRNILSVEGKGNVCFLTLNVLLYNICYSDILEVTDSIALCSSYSLPSLTCPSGVLHGLDALRPDGSKVKSIQVRGSLLSWRASGFSMTFGH